MKTITLNGNVLNSTSKSAASWLTVLLLTFFFLAATPPLLHAQTSKADIKAAGKAVDAAEDLLDDLNDNIRKLEKTIKNLDSDITKESANLGKLIQKRMTADKTSSDALKKQTDKLESVIATLQGKRNAAVVQLADLTKQRDAAATQLNAATAQLTNLKGLPKLPVAATPAATPVPDRRHRR